MNLCYSNEELSSFDRRLCHADPKQKQKNSSHSLETIKDILSAHGFSTNMCSHCNFDGPGPTRKNKTDIY